MSTLQIFTSVGRLKSAAEFAHDQAEIDGLSPERRACFDHLLEAAAECEAAEAALKGAQADVEKSVRAHRDAIAALPAPPTFLDCWRETFKS